MTWIEAYKTECLIQNNKIPFIAILNKETGKAELDYADEYLETHHDLEVSKSLFVEKHNCVYIELL